MYDYIKMKTQDKIILDQESALVTDSKMVLKDIKHYINAEKMEPELCNLLINSAAILQRVIKQA